MTRMLALTVAAVAVLALPLNGFAAEANSDLSVAGVAEVTPPGGGSSPACGGNSDSCGEGCATACCMPTWRPFAEFLYLRPGNDRIAYAVPFNGPIDPDSVPVQIGLESVVDNTFSPGYRVGVLRGLNDNATIGLTYTWFESEASDGVTFDQPVLRSLVRHPSTVAANSDFLTAGANDTIRFQFADVDYRRTLYCGELYALSCVGGFRYVNLEQDFRSTFTNLTRTETVNSDVDFEGGGIRLGMEAERHSCGAGLMVYGKGFASFLGGAARARHQQSDTLRGNVVNTGWDEDRLVSVVDMELGLGWTNQSGCFRVTAGYLASIWFNTLSPRDVIRAIQTNETNRTADLSNPLSFDGLTVRSELRF